MVLLQGSNIEYVNDMFLTKFASKIEEHQQESDRILQEIMRPKPQMARGIKKWAKA